MKWRVVIIQNKQNLAFVGIDMHKVAHTAVILDCWFEKLGEITFENRPSKFEKFLKDVKKIAGKLTPVFGLEDTSSFGRSLAMFLLEHRCVVKEVNPAYTKSVRSSNPTVYKDDPNDAYCIARVLRDMFDTLKVANPQDIFFTIHHLVKRRDGLAVSLISVQNQLHTQLMYSYPKYKEFFAEIARETALFFWKTYPSPIHLRGITAEELGKQLREHSHNSISVKRAEKILSLVAEDGYASSEYQADKDFITRSIVKEIRYKKEAIAEIDKELDRIIPMTGYKLRSMPGIDINTEAHIIAQIGDVNRFGSSDKLARFAGTAPVVFASGGRSIEKRSRQGNRGLNAILYFLAVQQVQTHSVTKKPRNPAFRAYFEKKLSEGKSKPQALTSITGKLIRIIYSMMKHKTEYHISDMAG